MTTYRLYVNLPEPDHFLSAISTIIIGCMDNTACNYAPNATFDDGTCEYDSCGGTNLPANVAATTSQIRITTTTSFHQDAIGHSTATGIMPLLLTFYPDLLYDSWVTIGYAPESGASPVTVNTIASPTQNWVAAFEAGGDLIMDDIIGGLWYIYNDGNDQGVPDAEGRVLIAQLTTDGVVDVELSGQYFPDFGTGVNGEADGTQDELFLTSLDDPCGSDPNAGCTYADAGLDCDGNCLNDADADGVCDEVDDCIGTVDACGICNGPGAIYDCGCTAIPAGDCDCNGQQLDAIGTCGGSCSNDADADGICDDVDPCVGTLDACGVCNGPGAIYDCGCTGIPAGDCDCNGNQSDALGICGGSCSADSDADGICDDVDPCVGQYDALGECNGLCPADADADGLCDDADPCVGDYDALGVCNGDCPADVDGDGVCDNAEIPGCTDAAACNFNPAATDEDGSCSVLDAVGDCGGDCAADADQDGICDDVDPCVGSLDACGVCNGPGEIYDCGCSGIPFGDCDCDGNQLDIVGTCGGSCTADDDGDGICDDVDPCVGQYDACGVCNGVGDIFQCGCANIPAGDCDCDGQQLDVLGVCGGTCLEDNDGDGICDDIDPCVGSLDACGVCNGPGEIHDCGCTGIAPGDCDCDGNQPDALGVCGGPCPADLDEDGICDDVDGCVGLLDVCGVCNGVGDAFQCGCTNLPAGDCDCDGNQLDVLGVCGGSCAEDNDGDGICDDIDPCVGSLDACGVCNGPGEIHDCGCTGIAPGDCDCDGLQLDALGICGGTCQADADQDGICDDVDDCVGVLDGCGVCNGVGASFQCGCTNIPAGDCDCDGNQLDAIGICGGDCAADLDGNGICDAAELGGCTYPEATNFDGAANLDDGSCIFTSGCPEGACYFDVNEDGGVGATDLLIFLLYFGEPCTN